MKKILLAMLALGLFATAVFADSDSIPIKMHQLPDAARELVKKYFGGIDLSTATMETGIAPSYEVRLVDGTEIDFDSRGQWTDIERVNGIIPDALIPMPIAKFVVANYPDQQIAGIERDAKSHEIRLENGLKLTFNRKYQLVEADR